MKEDKKIPLDTLRDNLQAQMNYEDPDKAIDAFLSGWINHPKYSSPSEVTMYYRRMTDGYYWLKSIEIPSFEAYIGKKLL